MLRNPAWEAVYKLWGVWNQICRYEQMHLCNVVYYHAILSTTRHEGEGWMESAPSGPKKWRL